MLHSRSIIKPHIPTNANLTAATLAILIQTHGLNAFAAEISEQSTNVQQSDAQQEVSIEAKRQTEQAERQTAIVKQSVILSGTPDAGPQSDHLSAIVGLGAGLGPAYLGSKKDKVSPIPYVDVRGLLGGRLYISDVGGLGLNVVEAGPFRAGLNVTLAGGRKSSADERLRGLPDIGAAASGGGFLAYSYKSFAFEATVAHRFGPHPETGGALGATYTVSPRRDLQLTASSSLTWSNNLNTFFGISPSDAARAAAVRNPLPVYTPGSGLQTFGTAVTAVYHLRDHWGLVARAGFVDLIGDSVRNSPLTLRAFQPSYQTGVLYIF